MANNIFRRLIGDVSDIKDQFFAEKDFEDWGEEDDNYLSRLGVDTLDTTPEETEPRTTSVPPPEGLGYGGGYGDIDPPRYVRNIGPATVRMEMEHPIEVIRNPYEYENGNFRMVETYKCGDQVFDSMSNAQMWASREFGYRDREIGRNEEVDQETSMRLMNEVIYKIQDVIVNNANMFRNGNGMYVINQILDRFKELNYIDRHSFNRDPDSFGYRLNLQKSEYVVWHSLDTGYLNF
jgi:hypothetical protein